MSFISPDDLPDVLQTLIPIILLTPILIPLLSYLRPLLTLLHLLHRVKSTSRYAKRNPSWSFLTVWSDRVRRTPRRTFLKTVDDEKEKLTYDDVDSRSNRVARAVQNIYGSDDDDDDDDGGKKRTVAVFLKSDWFLVVCWIGIVKTGRTAGLINAGLRGKGLAHAIRTSLEGGDDDDEGGGILVVSEGELCDRLKDVEVTTVLEQMKVTVLVKSSSSASASDESDSRPYRNFDNLLSQTPPDPISPVVPPTHSTPLLYIFTSGTTGLPKASIITHLRFHAGGQFFSTIAGLTPLDVIYCALPLYHSAGGMMGVGGCVQSGAAMVIRETFSARRLARDLVWEGCTVLQYIGEYGRFALAA
eukprot:CAMPEP_0172480212 /NCGR_PEP_ID=MMETSP1066-20121228/5255_1 /TAXON_ID=671091 /ORGANISM="Coscinodiscus wailesii, Strain CCMP2513" /LENGTH=358 /DNA_ID=CAMNT_0013241341 /DNA_START=23 /DNA_END=1095 /DNA_ORIENTATION=+